MLVAHGTKSVSSRRLAPPEPQEEYLDDSYLLLTPRLTQEEPLVALATNAALLAVCAVHVVDMMHPNTHEIVYRVTECRIQVTPLHEPFSGRYRNDVHRMRLPADVSVDTSRNTTATLADKSLMLHLPTDGDDDILLVFQLRRPRREHRPPEAPPLPSYISPPPADDQDDDYVPIATNPTLLRGTCAVDVGLAWILANADGLHLVAARPARVIGTLVPYTGVTSMTYNYGRLLVEHAENLLSINDLQVVGADEQLALAFRADEDVADEARDISRSVALTTGDGRSVHVALRHTVTLTAPASLQARAWVSPAHLAMAYHDRVSIHVVTNDSLFAKPATTLTMTVEDLEECATTRFVVHDNEPPAATSSPCSLEFDDATGCLLVSGTVQSRDGCVPFACVWNWRNNVRGPTLAPRGCKTGGVSTHRLSISQAKTGRHLVFIMGNERRFVKETWSAGVLSPRANFYGRGLDRHAPLFMTNSSVMFPCLENMTCRGDHILSWKEVALPSDYLMTRGAPKLAAVGRELGHTVAVASSHGFCTLSSEVMVDGKVPKWHFFSNLDEENKFSVVSFQWWENAFDGQHVLVAITEIQEDEFSLPQLYLSAWALNRVDRHQQLLCGSLAANGDSNWGILLPVEFHQPTLDLLSCPTSMNGSRFATALVASSDSTDTLFAVVQLCANSDDGKHTASSYIDDQPFHILGAISMTHSLGSSANLFLASVCANGPTSSESFDDTSDGCVATLAVIRHSSIVNAIAVSNTSIVAVAELVGPAENDVCEVTGYYLSDVEHVDPSDKGGTVGRFVWTFLFSTGRVFSWSVPMLNCGSELSSVSTKALTHPRSDENFGMSTVVHKHADILGRMSDIGSTSTWMLPSPTMTMTELPLGSLPHFGCVLSAGQSCKHLHQSTAENLDTSSLLPDFLDHDLLRVSNVTLSPPLFATSILVNLVAVAEATGAVRETYLVSSLSAKLATYPLREGTLMALQLLALRSVEKMAGGSQAARCIFSILTRLCYSILPEVEFCSLFIEIARQLEPSVSPHMFPLAVGLRKFSIESLVSMLLGYGDLVGAAAILPLLDKSTARRRCTAMLEAILRDATEEATRPTTFPKDVDGRKLLSDLFRFGLKLSSTSPSLGVHSLAHSTEDDGSAQSDESTVKDEQQNGYTMFCSISRILFGNKEERAILSAASEFIHRGFEEDEPSESVAFEEDRIISATSSPTSRASNGPAIYITQLCARKLLQLVVERKDAQSWRVAGGLASLLVGESLEGLPHASSQEFCSLLKIWGPDRLQNVCFKFYLDVPSFLQEIIRRAEAAPNERAAGLLLDLILVILISSETSEQFEDDKTCLALIAVALTNLAGRSTLLDSAGGDLLREALRQAINS